MVWPIGVTFSDAAIVGDASGRAQEAGECFPQNDHRGLN